MSRNYPTYREGEGFPGHTCISINEEVVHGIPGGRPLRDGDVVTLDLALKVDGYCCDTAITVPIGTVPPKVQKLLDVTRETLELAVRHMKPNKKWTEVARLMQYHVERNGFSVVREFVGHGVGRSMHEDPKVPNFVTQEHLRGDFRLRPGMTIAVEPMVTMGRRDVDLLDDGLDGGHEGPAAGRPFRAHGRHHRARCRRPERRPDAGVGCRPGPGRTEPPPGLIHSPGSVFPAHAAVASGFLTRPCGFCRLALC